jgi:E3 SUMO-protein ligase NSE2
VERYEREVEKKTNTYSNKTTRKKYSKSEAYIAFREAIWVYMMCSFYRLINLLKPLQEAQNLDKGMPPIVELIPAGQCLWSPNVHEFTLFTEEGDDDDDDDDDIQVGGLTVGLKCPLTLITMNEPVTSYVINLLIFYLPHLMKSF